MKRVILAASLLFLPLSAQADALNKVIDDLQWIKSYQPAMWKILDSFALEFDQTRPSLCSLSVQAKAIARAERLSIDLIGMQHHAPHQDAEAKQQVLSSQRRVAELLDSLQAAVIGVEGSSAEVLSQPDSAEAAEDGALAYFLCRPEITIFGLENGALNRLEYVTLVFREYFYSEYSFDPPALVALTDDLQAARSQIAVERTIVKLRTLGRSRAVIVMGARHQFDFPRLITDYGFHYRYFPAADLPE